MLKITITGTLENLQEDLKSYLERANNVGPMQQEFIIRILDENEIEYEVEEI